MNKKQFVEILSNPDLVSDQTLSEIKEIIDEYPFFQIGRMLLLKNLHKLDHIRYNSELKHSAVYIADRNKLFSLINDLDKPKVKEGEFAENGKESDYTKGEAEEEQLSTTNTATEIPNEKTQPTINITDNYLNATDEFTNDDANIYNFSTIDKQEPPEETKHHELQNIILPAADLLDYEISTSTGYSLPKLHEIENLDPNENRSFSDWLHIMRYSSSVTKQKNKKESTQGMNLIDNFLNSKPQAITPPEPKTKEIDLSENKASNQDEILSETLADIYVKQGHKSKAISILEKLLLKYPEKNVYFAQRISDLKEN